MQDANPYAPPAVAEPQMDSVLLWSVEGIGLLVRDGAVLPEVDVETGEREPGMKARKRTWQPQQQPFVWIIILNTAIIASVKDPVWKFAAICLIGPAVILVLKLCLGKRPVQKKIVITEFISRKHGSTLNRRAAVAVGIVAAVIIGSVILTRELSSLPELLTAIGCLALMGMAIALSPLMGRDKARTRAGPEGWLMIQPVHPDALLYLREKQQDLLDAAHSRQEMRLRPNEKPLTIHRKPVPAKTPGPP